MGLRLYNTLTRTIEEFRPADPPQVRMYHCGPTVYSEPTIGNFRSFLFADFLRRVLESHGHRVLQVMNITDVGHMTGEDEDRGRDKLEVAAEKRGVDPWAIARLYTEKFFEGLDLLRVRRAHHYPRATEHIPQMISLIEKLLARGLAYEVGGNVYYDVTKFEGYGKLSGNTLDDVQAGARIEVNPEKRHPADFALWKRDPKHLMQWDSPWGRGFPGWHIECSAMSLQYLGETFDIHTGGEDNVFPHHECEIAQSEGALGRPVVGTWLHVRFLLVGGGRMGKSEGNVVSLPDLVAAGYDGAALRYLLLRVHYRQPLNYTQEALDDARQAVRRIRAFHRGLTEIPATRPPQSTLPGILEAFTGSWRDALDEDLNASAALGALFEMIRAVNRLELGKQDAARVLSVLAAADEILDVLQEAPVALDAEVEDLLRRREDARGARDFAQADRIRDELQARGIVLEDTPQGTRWHRA